MRLEPDIDSASIFAEVLRREGDRWITEIVRGLQAMLSLASIGLTATPCPISTRGSICPTRLRRYLEVRLELIFEGRGEWQSRRWDRRSANRR